MEFLLHKLLEIIRSPQYISIVCACFIGTYYIISACFINAVKKNKTTGVWKKNGVVDIATSVVWVLVTLLLIWSLTELTYKNELNLGYLVLYYFFFLFLFAFCYGLLQWHFPGMLENVDPDCWEAECQYVLLSIQTQTTLGYTKAKPAKTITEFIAALQALLGIFFTIIFIAKAVNKMTP